MSVATDTFQDMENLQGFEGLSALEESAVRLHERVSDGGTGERWRVFHGGFGGL